MDHLADSIAKQCQGRKNRYKGREGRSSEWWYLGRIWTCNILECLDLSIGQRVDVFGLPGISNEVLGCWDSYKVICDLLHHEAVYCLCSVGLGVSVKVLQHSSNTEIVSIIFGCPPFSPSLDCFDFIYVFVVVGVPYCWIVIQLWPNKVFIGEWFQVLIIDPFVSFKKYKTLSMPSADMLI